MTVIAFLAVVATVFGDSNAAAAGSPHRVDGTPVLGQPTATNARASDRHMSSSRRDVQKTIAKHPFRKLLSGSNSTKLQRSLTARGRRNAIYGSCAANDTLKEAQAALLNSVANCNTENCTELSFSDCKALTSVPPGMEWPASLEVLNLDNNGLTQLPEQPWPASLEWLDLNNNALTQLPEQPWPASLRVLYLENNALTQLPEQPWPASLKFLYLSNNALTQLPEQPWPASLEVLDLSNNALTQLSDQPWPASLKNLYLNNNALTQLPEQPWPASLERLYLSFNDLTQLPEQPWPASLEELNLYNNAIKQVPEQPWPASLKNLYLNNNALTQLPEQSWPASLKRLYIYNNALKQLPEQPWPASLELLYLGNNDLTQLPEQPWPASLERLDLYNNGLTCLPQFPLPKQIQSLDLSSNSFAFESPETINAFNIAISNSAIRTLDLSNNAAKSLTSGIALPTTLVTLDLSNNQLRSLPDHQTENFTWPRSFQSLIVDDNTWEDLEVLKDAARVQAPAGTLMIVFEMPCGPAAESTRKKDVGSGFGSGFGVGSGFGSGFGFGDDDFFSGYLSGYLSGYGDADVFVIGGLFGYGDDDFFGGFSTAEVSISANHANWNDCTTTAAADAASASICTVSCKLTQAGERLAANLPEGRAAAIARDNAKYVPVWSAGIPLAAVSSVGMYVAVNPATKMEKCRIAVFFLAVVDLTTDWAFYSIEVSGSAFEEQYTCNQSAPELAPTKVCKLNGEDAPYTCASNDYGVLLKHKCGTMADPSIYDGNIDAANECECNYAECRSYGGQCETSRGSEYALACNSYNGLDAQANETCGTLSPALGGNECECYRGECTDVPDTGGTCPRPGSADNNYAALKSACLACNVVATIVWIVQWTSFVMHARAKRRSPSPEAASSAGSMQGQQTMRTVNTAAMIATTLFEDVPQMAFLTTFVMYMDFFSSDSDGVFWRLCFKTIPPSPTPTGDAEEGSGMKGSTQAVVNPVFNKEEEGALAGGGDAVAAHTATPASEVEPADEAAASRAVAEAKLVEAAASPAASEAKAAGEAA
eukprot:gene8696-25518_t